MHGIRAVSQATLSVSETSIVRDGWMGSTGGKGSRLTDPVVSSDLAWSAELCPQLTRGDLLAPRDPTLALIQSDLMAFMAEGSPAKTALRRGNSLIEGPDGMVGSSKGKNVVPQALKERWNLFDVKEGLEIPTGDTRRENLIFSGRGEKKFRGNMEASEGDLSLVRRVAAVTFTVPSSVHLANISGMREEMLKMGSPPQLTRAILRASNMLFRTGRLLDCTQDLELLRVCDNCSQSLEIPVFCDL